MHRQGRRTGTNPTDAIIDFVRDSLAARADPKKAAEMAAYMKTSMPFYGVAKPLRADIERAIKRIFAPATRRECERAVMGLWRLEHREEKYLAISVARMYPEFIAPESLKIYERMIREGGWWDFVDEIASKLVGAVLLENRPLVAPIMDRWIRDDDLWIRRAAILSQIGHKAATDHAQLFGYCTLCAGENEFFVRKAIGWALRQYSYTAPDRVRAFVRANRTHLSPLSYREAMRVIEAKAD
ncbi:MAG TPA: DNA alkylation repair protein [Candidatus Binataceae bacterium]|nr:DNA alkylation repair protein [Candidatus Binataceae bacterium]